jgi:hypothetical protein
MLEDCSDTILQTELCKELLILLEVRLPQEAQEELVQMEQMVEIHLVLLQELLVLLVSVEAQEVLEYLADLSAGI